MTLPNIVTERPLPVQHPSALEAADLYVHTFAGRLDAYSVFAGDHWQTATKRTSPDLPPVRLPLTGEVAVKAFETGIPISSYFIGADNATHVAALDLDRADGYELGMKLLAKLRELGGIGYIEASRRGCHIWVILSDRRPALLVKLGLRAIINEALGEQRLCPGVGKAAVPHAKTGKPVCPGCDHAATSKVMPEHDDPKIELRPASDRLGEAHEGEDAPLGHCLRMPTMPHPSLHKRWSLVSSDGEKLPGRLVEFITLIELTPVHVLEDAAERAPLPEVHVAPPRALLRPYGEKEQTGAYSESMTKILMDLWGVQQSLTPGRGFRCPAHDDTNKSAMLHRSDERVLCYSPECWIHNDGSGRGTIEMTKNAPRGK